MPETYPVVGKPYPARYLTPSLADYVVAVRKDSKTPNYAEPAVGSPWVVTGIAADDTKYAAFKFAAVKPDQEGDKFVFWFYVKDRANQDAYNYTIEFNYGSERYPSYIRTYVLLRASYTTPAIGSADPVVAGAVLVAPDRVLRSDDPVIDSMYVLVQRRYDIIPNLATTADLDDLKTFGYVATFPYADKDFPNVKWKVKVTSYTEAQMLAVNCPVSPYTALVLIGHTLDRTEKDGSVVVIREYELVPGPILTEYKYPDDRSRIAVTHQVVAASTLPTTPVDGVLEESKIIDAFRSWKIRAAITPSSRTWTSWEHIPLPRVLDHFNPDAWTDKLTSPDGPNILKAGFDALLIDYSTTYEVTYLEEWQAALWTGLAAFNPLPQGFSWDTPFSSGSVPPCLHVDIHIAGSTGTTHPVYAFNAWDYFYPATNFTSIASGPLVVSDRQEPYKGGWLRTKRTITIP